ncbi:phosphopantothenate--cysteine ligase family flavoprotein [Novosphingobium sp. TH158]|uniref:bifunctional phosphopantothenoylcysteine decarboxylase/phosphopantothenate synthase n=1 Tax=Novosphingobium sp. TH158 TaxID=2067455 RepID=UPI000C79E68A|nr:bifunctional phosphopantothenoylcysteine decarboxylase/phosphopantothenate synthase [Novosphingobium sp. TH158]PLK26462.1 peptidase [Novosphingobium sp. TH158]
MSGPRILLVVGGGIAAYKSCELVRLIRKHGGSVTCVLTEGGSQFVTAMSLAALSENPVHTTLWDLRNEAEMGHIRLSREADLVVVCPATADLLARMAAGIADDLATTLLLATDKPVVAVPAMNVRMWLHPATQRNVRTLTEAGCLVVEPAEGDMACGEYGPGRLPEPEAIWARIASLFEGPDALPIQGGSAPAAGSILEAVEPDEEDEGGADIGLGGLASKLIQRITKGRARSIEDEFVPDMGDPVELPIPATGDTPVVAAGGPLAKKGKARAAPPTDPQAINHMVNANQSAPEPIPGDDHGVRVDDPLAFDPLAGQPDFDSRESAEGPLSGKHILITAGPTHEPIDPVRYIANRSSGKQGYAIAAAAARLGARVTLVSGPVTLPTPRGVDRIDVETAQQMAAAVKDSLPADCAIMVAAVADWRTKDVAQGKIKKRGSAPPVLMLTENPDILASVAAGGRKPRLLVGFAAETDNVLQHATEKRARKGADWIIANDVSGDVMGGSANQIAIISKDGVEHLPEMPKDQVANAIMERIAIALEATDA